LETIHTGPVDGSRYALHPVEVGLDEFKLDGTLLVRGETAILIIDSEIPQGTIALINFDMDAVRHQVTVEIGKTYSRTSAAAYMEVIHAPHDRIEDAVWRRLMHHKPPAPILGTEPDQRLQDGSSFSIE
jgi:hypothetical protein